MNKFKVQNPRQPKICDVCHKYNQEEPEPSAFWGQICCAEHYNDKTPRCRECLRFTQGDDCTQEYVDLRDGRKLCSDCYSIAIMGQEECKIVIEAVRAFYKHISLDFDEEYIPILLVDQDELNRLYGLADDGPEPAGLMLLDPPFPTNPIVMIQRCSKRGETIQVEKKVDKLTMLQILAAIFRFDKKVISLVIRFLLNKLVIRVVLLFGQPDVVIGGILAHEMMHAWLELRLRGCRKLEAWVEEGICCVMEYMWMQWFCSSGAEYSSYKTKEQVQYTRNLKKFRSQYMKNDESKIYGRGFRLAREAVKTYGLHATLEHIVSTGSLPKQDDQQDQMEAPFLCIENDDSTVNLQL